MLPWIASYNRTIRQRLYLASLSVILGYAVYQYGGVASTAWNICLLALGVTAAVYWLAARAVPEASSASWLLLFPGYIALQLLPLPLFLLRLISSPRADTLDSLARLTPPAHFAPLATAPAITVTHLVRIIAYVLTFILVRIMAGRLPGRRRWCLVAPLVAVATAEAALGLFQNVRIEEVQGTYINKNHFAGLLEMALPLTVAYAAYLFSARSRGKASGVLAAALIVFAGLVASLSKMGFAASLAGLFVMGVLATAGRVPGKRKWMVIGGLGALIVFCFVFLPSDAFVANYGGVLSKQQAALEGRAPIWRDTLHLIADYPLFGCGLGTYQTAFLKYQTSVVDRVFTYAHNDYLQIAAELGVIGFLIAAILVVPIFAGTFRASFRAADRTSRFLALGCAGAIMAMCIHSFTDFNMYVPANAFVFAWICGIGSSLPPGSKLPAAERHRVFFARLAIALSVIVIIYAPLRLLFNSQFRSDTRMESLFCHFGICDTDAVIAAQTLAHGGRLAEVPTPVLFKALRRDPNDPSRWCDTGDRLLQVGQPTEAEYCYSRALALGAHIPPTLMRAADFYFANHQVTQSLGSMSRILADTSTYDDLIFAWYAKNKIPIADILQHGLPPGSRAAQACLRDMLAANDLIGAIETWHWIVAHRLGDDRLAREFVDYLFEKHEYANAANAWAEYLGPRRNGYLESNWVFNGSFESPFSQSALDWRVDAHDGVEAAEDAQMAQSGSHSMRIHFEGKENLDYHGVTQTAFVKPGLYRFEVYIKTEDLTTDEGAGLHIYDRESTSRLDVRMEPLNGTHGWTKIERVITIPKETQLLNIEVYRQPSMRFDNQVKGTIWIDSVSLTPVR
jgi:O-antigen ligase